MSSSESKIPKQSHVRVQETATNTQVLISWGEDVLDRVHQVAHEIEEHVRQLLAAPPANHP